MMPVVSMVASGPQDLIDFFPEIINRAKSTRFKKSIIDFNSDLLSEL